MQPSPLDDLYRVEPGRFVAERARLLLEAKAAGDDALAAEIRAARRPSLTAWVVNRLALDRSGDLRALLDAGDEVRAAQASVLRGGDPAAMREAQRAEREATARLLQGARELFEATGREPGAAELRRIAQTLRAAATGDARTRARVRAGRLDRDLTPSPEFGTGSVEVAAPHPALRKKKPAQAKREDDRAARKRAAAEARRRAVVAAHRASIAVAKRRLEAAEKQAAARARERALAEEAETAARRRARAARLREKEARREVEAARAALRKLG